MFFQLADDARSGNDVRRGTERCYECHTTIRREDDHLQGCTFKKLLFSTHVDRYVSIPVIRCAIYSKTDFQYISGGTNINFEPNKQLFSAIADVYMKSASRMQVSLLTTGFTRVRLPIVVAEEVGRETTLTERLVLMTSQDRTIVAANSGRIVSAENAVKGYEHSTPVVLYLHHDRNEDASLMVEVFGTGGQYIRYPIEYRQKKYTIPTDLDVHTKTFKPNPFDADVKSKR